MFLKHNLVYVAPHLIVLTSTLDLPLRHKKVQYLLRIDKGSRAVSCIIGSSADTINGTMGKYISHESPHFALSVYIKYIILGHK